MKLSLNDMIRAKAETMGRDIRDLSDNVLDEYVAQNETQTTLLNAKLCLENYMMGNFTPADFATILAGNDKLRYAVSDLCRMRLEPREFNVQRNDKYIDVGAGIKTFWSEMQVPIPSEREAARDLHNIALGVEAGQRGRKAQTEVKSENTSTDALKGRTVEDKHRRRSFREVLESARQHVAKAMIEKLTPIAERKKLEIELDAEWLASEEGQTYKSEYTRKAAQQVENVVMDIEAGKDPRLVFDERMKAMQASGMDEESARNVAKETATGPRLRSKYSAEQLNTCTDTQMDTLLTQIGQHMGQTAKNSQQAKSGQHMGQTAKNSQQAKSERRDDRVHGVFEGKEVSFKNKWSTHTFTENEVKRLLNGETISFDYQNRNGKTRTMSGKLEWMEYDGRPYLGFEPDFMKRHQQAETNMQSVAASGDELPAKVEQDLKNEPPVLTSEDLDGLLDDDSIAVAL